MVSHTVWDWLSPELLQHIAMLAPVHALPTLVLLNRRTCEAEAVGRRLSKLTALTKSPFHLTCSDMLSSTHVNLSAHTSKRDENFGHFVGVGHPDNTPIGDEGAVTVADGIIAGAFQWCEKLHLLSCRIGTTGMTALADAFCSGALNLRVLTFEGNSVGNAGITSLGDACTRGALPQLRQLTVNDDKISYAGLQHFCTAGTTGGLANLEHLTLGGPWFGPAEMALLAQALNKGAWESLSLITLRLWNQFYAAPIQLAEDAGRALGAACEARHITPYILGAELRADESDDESDDAHLWPNDHIDEDDEDVGGEDEGGEDKGAED